MLLSSITELSSFPFETIQININNSVSPETNSRFGVRFRDSYWNISNKLVNFDTLSLKQAGSEPLIINNNTLSAQYDLTQTDQYTQPTNFLDLPSDFPLFFASSSIPHNDITLTFRGGISAITIFPATPYPKITKTTNNNFVISGAYVPLTAFNNENNKEYFKQTFNEQALQNLENRNAKILFNNNSFKSAHKKDYVWFTTINNITDTAFDAVPIPANIPYASNIIKESFLMTLPISATYLDTVYNYYLSYANMANGVAHLSSIALTIFTTNPILCAILYPATGRFSLVLNSGYIIPKANDILVSYETSSFYATTVSNPAINTFDITTNISPYLLNHTFTLSSPANSTQDAFTVNFSPSSLLLSTGVTSSVSLSTVMVDNFYQTFFPILTSDVVIKFEEILIGESTLSAIDPQTNTTYIGTQWMPASANLIFINDGLANNHTIALTVSANNDSIWEYEMPSFILNRDNAAITVVLSEFNDTSALVVASIAPDYDPLLQVKWTVEPRENIIIYNSVSAIPLDTYIDASDLQIRVENLGVEPTTISLYSQEFDTTGSTVWLPSSASFAGISLSLAGTLDDFNEIKVADLSALVKKGGFYYACPTIDMIKWAEIYDDSRGTTTFKDSSGNLLFENTVYSATRNNSIIKPVFTTPFVEQNPANIIFDVQATLISTLYNLQANILFSAREYPSLANLYANVSSLSGEIFSTLNSDTWIFTDTDRVTAVAVVSAFDNLPLGNIRWTLPDSSVVSGISASFDLTADFCLSVSALSATPKFGGFTAYNFVDNVCLYVIDNLPNLDFVAFPQTVYYPENALTINNFSNSPGLTALNDCGSQTIIVSTFGGFDEYLYSIGSKTLSSTSNIINFPVTFNDVSATSAISISAFSEKFIRANPLTVFNFVSSDNSNKFKQFVQFRDIPNIIPLLQVDRNAINLNALETTFFNTAITYPNSGINISTGNYVYVLSSSNGIKVDETIQDIATLNEMHEFTPNSLDFFSISANTYNVFNFYVSGNLVKMPNSVCSFSQPFSSNVVSLSVYFGSPDLRIFVTQNIYGTNETVYFSNQTDQVLPVPADYFVFDDGMGHIQTVFSYLSALTGIYTTEGTYDVTLTAVYDGIPIVKVWEDFIIIKDTFTAYNSAYNREFPAELILPYSCDDIRVSPNAWQFATTLNDAFKKIQTNIEFLSAMTITNNILFPKYYVGYWGQTENGTATWSYSSPTNLLATNNFKDGIVINNKFFVINNHIIQVRNNDFGFSVDTSITHINEGEVFSNPNRIVYNSALNKVIIMDQDAKFVYVFTLVGNTIVLTHYWGGIGEANSRTRLNNPTDLHINAQDDLFIVDKDSKNVKCHNKYLNWIYALSHSEWTIDNAPVSVSSSVQYTFVLTSNATVYIFENDIFIDKFAANAGHRIICDSNSPGLIYILSDTIYVYSENGIYINKYQNIPFMPLGLVFLHNEIYVVGEHAILKIINFVQYDSILDVAQLASIWNYDAFAIMPGEPVTDYVLNDSFKKIHDNMMLFSADIKRKFIIYLDEYGQFNRQELHDIDTNEVLLSASSFEHIGLNEIVSFDVLDRCFDNVCNDMVLLQQTIDVQYEQLPLSGICWTWKHHKITTSQNINNNVRPYSWIELRHNNIFLPEVSAITWQTARACCGANNPMPVCWIWENMACECIFPMKWSELTCGSFFERKWSTLEDNCCGETEKYFDNCEEICK